jgi:hypothetical protein
LIAARSPEDFGRGVQMKKAPAGDNGGSLLAFSTFLESEPRNHRIVRYRELVASIKDDVCCEARARNAHALALTLLATSGALPCMLTVNWQAGISMFWPSVLGNGAYVFALVFAAIVRNVARVFVDARYRI